jgi:hypothetical protein
MWVEHEFVDSRLGGGETYIYVFIIAFFNPILGNLA